ncbi:unnamed protein product [Closterium sp. Naga37s-1]|nr:unnamed protein product [Closterium sp. Naga37s-1]
MHHQLPPLPVHHQLHRSPAHAPLLQSLAARNQKFPLERILLQTILEAEIEVQAEQVQPALPPSLSPLPPSPLPPSPPGFPRAVCTRSRRSGEQSTSTEEREAEGEERAGPGGEWYTIRAPKGGGDAVGGKVAGKAVAWLLLMPPCVEDAA